MYKHKCTTWQPSPALIPREETAELDLQGNVLTKLPDAVGDMEHLVSINLANNRFSEFPEHLTAVRTLEDINMESNQISGRGKSKFVNECDGRVNMEETSKHGKEREVTRRLWSAGRGWAFGSGGGKQARGVDGCDKHTQGSVLGCLEGTSSAGDGRIRSRQAVRFACGNEVREPQVTCRNPAAVEKLKNSRTFVTRHVIGSSVSKHMSYSDPLNDRQRKALARFARSTTGTPRPVTLLSSTRYLYKTPAHSLQQSDSKLNHGQDQRAVERHQEENCRPAPGWEEWIYDRQQAGVNKSLVGATVRKWKTFKNIDNLPRFGAPNPWGQNDHENGEHNPRTARGDLMNDLQRAGTKVTKATINNTLHPEGLRSCRARRVPLLKPVHVQARLTFAGEHMDDPEEDWENIMWSDGTKTELSGKNSTRRVWRKKDAELHPKNTIPTVEHVGGDIMPWGCCSAKGQDDSYVLGEE
ncbi:hypothetical protein NFI96_015023 [Prochilodus magdalenae]|nr:hypothetical protein NFI96_015023 [Prochilodus magdalenae]